MKLVLRVCLLLLWTLTAPVSTAGEVKVAEVSDGIKLTCGENYHVKPSEIKTIERTLAYNDENTGEYKCVSDDEDQTVGSKIFVKFRTCDNCVEFDTTSITGMVVGNVVATIVIGVAVYLIASQTRTAPTTSNKKSSDRQHLVPIDVSNRAPNDHYQPLKARQKDTYDVLNRK
ncbi:T-cell surface glycoprotein CD3 epsilon chain-like isoform X2 [Sebastes umbrosus]|uniref:T-cell surface glycoprotein CD3 epsilon chain-like isoform X2 n=1 Tax=Sebastes umbrosus TaxID=72105 RepID=UPI00189DC915|nr:T-cell surface glycoprotein CD3 epsilon chain-like isoform X2 [Sebastes umbrosus]XP_037630440.1 T-cell surface glycoprotein CD3 epsilon chain-like isoform X2 [Sebastes umbrosus]